MSQAGIVARLALRELWITFRLLVLLASFIGAGAVVALMPAPPPVTLGRLAIGFGAATILASALAAWSLAVERTRGRVAWLVSRSVSRGTYLIGWFVALAAVTLAGLAGGGTLGWLAASRVPLAVDGAEFAVVAIAIAGCTWAAIGLGLAAGSLAAPTAAAVGATLASSAIGLVSLILPGAASLAPGGAYLALPQIAGPDAVLPDALRAAGIGLGLAAVLLAVARLSIERADL